jgi:hypothetical protein
MQIQPVLMPPALPPGASRAGMVLVGDDEPLLGVPVILVSGSLHAHTLVIEPPSAFLAKPFALRDLAATATSLMAVSRVSN